MKPKILQQGAEAIILLDRNIIKKRIKKSYRLPILDEKIRKSRTKSESKIIQKASELIPVPEIIKTSLPEKEIEMQYIKGKKLSDHLDKLKNTKKVCEQIGKNIAKLHDAGIIHGDLTTSNMILSQNNKLYFIDFGLGFFSEKIEDKAVDLHLIKQALEAKHFLNYEKFFFSVLKGYKTSKNYAQTIKRLEKVELRGRYKAQS